MYVIMGVQLAFINSLFCAVLVLVTYSPTGVSGLQICDTGTFGPRKVCDDCCGNECCEDIIQNWSSSQNQAMEVVALFIVFMAVTCCCVCCYRCCCRRTTSQGFVYTTPGATTTMSVTLPPQQTQQVPYPTVVPYPQQTPYPPQYNPPTNPYYGMPPPAYGVAVQSGNQQASAPSAPYMS